MPSVVTMFAWLKKYPEFLKQYETAKEEQADALAEEMLDIADDGTNDWIERQGKDGDVSLALNTEHVQRSRLRVDTRKWIASKLKPKKYGEKVQTEHSGSMEIRNPIPLTEQATAAQRFIEAEVEKRIKQQEQP